jgi:hypothetical protein
VFVQWQVGDARDMKEMEDGSIDVAFDKGTFIGCDDLG